MFLPCNCSQIVCYSQMCFRSVRVWLVLGRGSQNWCHVLIHTALTCVRVCVRVCGVSVCACGACVCLCVRAHVSVCESARARVSVCESARARVSVCAHAYMSVCVRLRAYVFVRARFNDARIIIIIIIIIIETVRKFMCVQNTAVHILCTFRSSGSNRNGFSPLE